MKASIASGPTVDMVNAGVEIQMYQGGILNSKTCGDQVNHVVTIVGYADDYYIVRNSWGASWGEGGYIRVASGVEGTGVCGILTAGTRPETN